MTEEANDVDVVTSDDQTVDDIFRLDRKLRYYGFRPVGVIVSYQAKFLIIRDLRNKYISTTIDGNPALFGLVVERDPKYEERDFCIVLITGERVKSIEVETDRTRNQTKFTLNLDGEVATRYSLTEVKVAEN